MPNTIDSLGDIETFEAFISGQLTDYTDDDLLELNSNFNWGETSLVTLNLVNLELIKKGSIDNSNNTSLLSINLPKLKYAYSSFPGYTQNISQLNFPELRVITNGCNYALNENVQIVNYPKAETCQSLTIAEYASVFNIENLKAVRDIYLKSKTNGNPISRLRFPKLRYLFGQPCVFQAGYTDTDHQSTYNYYPDPKYSIYGSSLELVDLQYEDFKYISGSYFGGRADYQRSSGTLKVIIRSTNVPELRDTKKPSLNDNFQVYFYVPFFMLSKYLNDSKWSHTNFYSQLRIIESITNQSNHLITPDEVTIPYYQNNISYTCSLTADYTDNTNGTSLTNSDISYHMKQDIGVNASNNSITKTVSERYGDQTLSFQVTQTGVDFNSGYSIAGLRTYGWKEYSNSDFLSGYQYFEASESLFQNGILENGVQITYIEAPGVGEVTSQSKDIIIFINGLSSFDFYMIDDTSYDKQNYINSTSSNYSGYAHHFYTYIGNLDQLDISSNYKIRYDSNVYDRNTNLESTALELLSYKWYEYQSYGTTYAYAKHVTKSDVSDSITAWKHIEFTDIDPTVPHFIKIKCQTNVTLDRTSTDHYQKLFLAIPNSYTYNAIPMTVETD